MDLWRFCRTFVLAFSILELLCVSAEEKYKSAIGDPGMRRDNLRVAIESWNQCNEVGEEAPNMGSPRMADCFDVHGSESLRKCSLLFLSCKIVLFIIFAKMEAFDKNN